ncbi:hypothetical protein RZS08_29570, partial [Arthrospira platensis SPKY1]|nr:hypothetical protein [Arthrospira platensis SPKY1]
HSQEQMPDARTMNLNPQIIEFWMSQSHRRQRFAIAKTDFQNQWRPAAENPFGFQQGMTGFNTEPPPPFRERPSLGASRSTFATDKAPDSPWNTDTSTQTIGNRHSQ